MVPLVLALVLLALLISLPLASLMVALGHRLRAWDTPGVPGQVKAATRRVPNTGGVALFWAIALPMLAGLYALGRLDPAGAWLEDPTLVPEAMHEHIAGIRQQTPLALGLLGSLCLLHVLGLVDDRRPLGPWIKLAVMAIPTAAIAAFTDTRLLTALDAHVGGPWLSIAITILWFLVVTNAMNFMDNMDGLAAGVAAIAGACFLAATLINGQWFVAAVLALLVGACLGFLAFNFPRRGGARLFMGDGGSLVIGFLLAFLTARTTYFAGDPDAAPHALTSGAWYAVFMPLVVLAVPLYDLVSVVAIRLSQGRSPFVGDLQHFSHRLVGRGLSRPAAVLVIYGLTAVTGLAGVSLGSLRPWQAALVGVQTLLILGVIALFEYSGRTPPSPAAAPETTTKPALAPADNPTPPRG